jgi:hypothetical protein
MYNRGLQCFILDGNQTENDEIGKKNFTFALTFVHFQTFFCKKLKVIYWQVSIVLRLIHNEKIPTKYKIEAP